VRGSGSGVTLDFRGKSGKRHQIRVDDGRVVRVIRRCLDLPGESLFRYREGEDVRALAAADVNAYLKEVAGADVTSKDFRTWGGTVRAARHLAGMPRADTLSGRRGEMRAAIAAAAAALGNTPAVCRRSYIHPRVFECFEAGVAAEPERVRGLRADERAALALLSAEVPSLRDLLARSVARGRKRPSGGNTVTSP